MGKRKKIIFHFYILKKKKNHFKWKISCSGEKERPLKRQRPGLASKLRN